MTETPQTLPALPRWVRAADAVTVALLVLAAWVLATDGGRKVIFNIVISYRSPLPFLYWAAAIQVVRHVFVRTPTSWSRLRAWWAQAMARPAVAAAVRPFIATRLAVFFVGFFAVVTIGFAPGPVGFTLSPDPLANMPARFDAGWYASIAFDGYHWDQSKREQSNIAFFPAMPLLMQPVGYALGMTDVSSIRERQMLRALWGAVIVSLAAFLWALWYLARVGEELIGREQAASAVLLLAAYPFSLFYSAPYSESVFLLGAVGAFYHFRRGDWAAASLFGLLAGLSRPNGCFLSVPFGILALQHGWRMRADRGGAFDAAALRATGTRLLVAAMPGFGMLIFTAYLYRLTGVWFAWMRSQEAWGRTFDGAGPFITAFRWLTEESWIVVLTNVPFNVLNTAGLMFAVVLLMPVFRRLGLAWGVFVAVNVMMPVMAGGALSIGRLTSTLFPLFLALGAMLPLRSVPAWAAAFAVIQGLFAALFFTWRELF